MYFCDCDECPFVCVYSDGEITLFEPIALFWPDRPHTTVIEEIPF